MKQWRRWGHEVGIWKSRGKREEGEILWMTKLDRQNMLRSKTKTKTRNSYV